jgi:hypothetical protein
VENSDREGGRGVGRIEEGKDLETRIFVRLIERLPCRPILLDTVHRANTNPLQ